MTCAECQGPITWQWTGYVDNGYGRMYVGSRAGRRPRYAHRVSYEEFVGAIPDGLQIDHLCMNRLCVNPQHLEAVTGAENTRRAKRALHELARTCPLCELVCSSRAFLADHLTAEHMLVHGHRRSVRGEPPVH